MIMAFSLLSIKNLCEISGVPRSKIYQEMTAGRLPAFKVGRRTVIHTRDFLDWLDCNRLREKAGDSSLSTGRGRIDPELIRILCSGIENENRRAAYSISEFATITMLSRETVLREIKNGQLKVTPVGGGRTLIPTSEGIAWLKRLEARKAG
jgi:excisionase family DNA binding protein